MKKQFSFLIIVSIFFLLNCLHLIAAGMPDQMDWVNLQWPPQQNIPEGGSFNIYTRCYESEITGDAGSDTRITVWIGFNTENTNPNTWNNWLPATFNNQFENTDEYVVSLGNALPAGMYYYASRIQLNGETYQYGGYNPGGGGFWDGKANVSGILTVGKALASVVFANTLQLYDGNPKSISATTNPPGLALNVTYDGSDIIPANPGTYEVIAIINDLQFQGTAKGTLSIYAEPDDEASKELRNQFIWVMYDQVYNQEDLDLALSYKPDVISRGWFKWGNWGEFDYHDWSWMIDQSANQNIIFGGGETVQALYPDEADEATIMRMVERTPLNKPSYFLGDTTIGYYNGDCQNREYLDFLLSWLYKQIDAGAGTLHLDGLAAVPAANSGFSDYSMGEFNKFLIRKYCEGLGWTLDDSRWQSTFGINLATDCSNSTISTFDYRKFLLRNGYEKDPMNFNFELKKEFGVPWNYEGTYLDERNQQACEYLYTSLKNYSAGIGRQVTVTMNGFSKYVDYQTMGVWDSWKLNGGRLDISPSYIRHWRGIKEYSMKYLNRDIPLIVFHDWGFGMPFINEIPPEDQILWLRVYAPEIFASGSVFAWPVSGGGNLYKAVKAVQDTIISLVKWYDLNRNIYVNSFWNGDSLINLNGNSGIVKTVCDQYTDQKEVSRRIVHLINKNQDANGDLIGKNNFNIDVKTSRQPMAVWAASPDFSGYRRLDFTVLDGTVQVTVKSLEAYTVVVLDFESQEIPTHIRQNDGLDMELWPNPCHDVLRVKGLPESDHQVLVVDMFGKNCLSAVVNGMDLDVSSLQPGIYILKTRDSVCRFIKQ